LMREEQARGVTLGARDIPAIFRQFGFMSPVRIANWPASMPQPSLTRPLGMISRDVVGPTSLVRIDAVNLGCATCHSAATFDSSGRPVPGVAWIGAPSNAINLEAYTQA